MRERWLELEFRQLTGGRIRLNNDKTGEMDFILGPQLRIGEGFSAFSLRKDALAFVPTGDSLRVRIQIAHTEKVDVVTMNVMGCNILEYTLDDYVTETVGSGKFNIRLSGLD